ncbi:hypothetical protein VTN31DRAFT_3222 [Thermomyces dupontii]|uniref:uncharacterized protein n=1 Tax=Talaromyces thermophilus TaxID=28565 RepID=UPI00374444E9
MASHEQIALPHGEDLSSIHELPGDVAVEVPPPEEPVPADRKPNGAPAPGGPQPKTDKPRPHVCTTCTRSFARLEHLKRHERSHTKEKPFECPECTRCFARRDLLLRHQQKLHMTTTPSSRPRNARRESTGNAGAATARVRKNSIAGGSAPATVRPRANTISHVDASTLSMMSAAHANVTGGRQSGLDYHRNLGSVSAGFEAPPYSSAHPPNGLPKLDTSSLSMDTSASLRTAPVFGSFDLAIGDYNSNTVNPAQLHFSGSPQGYSQEAPVSPLDQGFQSLSSMTDPVIEDDPNFDWINGFDQAVGLGTTSDSAVEESSPSAMSTGSQSGTSDAMLDNTAQIASSATNWQQAPFSAAQSGAPFALDFSSPTFQDMGVPPDTVSPKALMTNQFTESLPNPQTAASINPPMWDGHSQIPSSLPSHHHRRTSSDVPVNRMMY